MTKSRDLVQALKTELRRAGLTYRQLAERLALSESAVKQMFAAGSFSLKRLDELCEVLDLDLAELVNLASRSGRTIEGLGAEREKELVSDVRLLLVAYCLVNHWTVEEILGQYFIPDTEMVRLLARLDRLGLIELLPGNRARLLISSSFRWTPNGPIERFFRTEVQTEFLRDGFAGEGALRLVKNGDLTAAGQQQIVERLEAAGQLFDDLCHEARRVPTARRRGATMFLAIRNWRFAAFTALERKAGDT